MAREKALSENTLKTRLDALAPQHHEVSLRELQDRFSALRPESSLPMFTEHLDGEVRSAWQRFEAEAEVTRQQLGGVLPSEVQGIQWDLTESLTVAHRVVFDTAVPVHEWTERQLERHLLTWADRREEILGEAHVGLKALTDTANGRVPQGKPRMVEGPAGRPDPVVSELDALKVPGHEPTGAADLEERYLELRRAEFVEAGMDPQEFRLGQIRLNLAVQDGNGREVMRLLDERQKALDDLPASRLKAAQAAEDELAGRLQQLRQNAPSASDGQAADRQVDDILGRLPDVPQTIPDAGGAADDTAGAAQKPVPEPPQPPVPTPPRTIAERVARLRADDPMPDGIGRQARDSGMPIKDVLGHEKAIDKAYAEGRTADALRLTSTYMEGIRQAQQEQRVTRTALRMRAFREGQAAEAGMSKGEVSKFEYEQYLEQFGKENGGGLPTVEKAHAAWNQRLVDATTRREATAEAILERRLKQLKIRPKKPADNPRTSGQDEAAAQRELEEKLSGLDAVPTALPEPGSKPSAPDDDPGPDLGDLPSVPDSNLKPTVDPELLQQFTTVLGRKPLDEMSLLGDSNPAARTDTKPDEPAKPDAPTSDIPTAPDHDPVNKPSAEQPPKHSDTSPASTAGDLQMERPRPARAKQDSAPENEQTAEPPTPVGPIPSIDDLRALLDQQPTDEPPQRIPSLGDLRALLDQQPVDEPTVPVPPDPVPTQRIPTISDLRTLLNQQPTDDPSNLAPPRRIPTIQDLRALLDQQPTDAPPTPKAGRTQPVGGWSADVQARSLRRLGKEPGKTPGGDAGQDFRLEFVKGEGEGFPRAVLGAVRNHPRRGDHAGLRQLLGMEGPQELRDVLAAKALAILRSAPDLHDLRELLRSRGLDPGAVVDQLRQSGDFWRLADDLAPRLLAEVFHLQVVLVDLDGGQEVHPPPRPRGLSDVLPEFVLVRDRTQGTDHYWLAIPGSDHAMALAMDQSEESAPDPEAEEFAQDLATVGRLGVGTPEQLVEFGKLWRLYLGPQTGPGVGSDALDARWNSLYFAINNALDSAGAARELYVGAEFDRGSPVMRSDRQFGGFASVVGRIVSSAAGQPKHTAKVLLDWLDHRIPLGELPAAAQEFALLTHLTAVVGGERQILDSIRVTLEGIVEAEDADAPRLWRAIRDTWSTAVDLAGEVEPPLDLPRMTWRDRDMQDTGETTSEQPPGTMSVSDPARPTVTASPTGAGLEVFSGVPGMDADAVRAFASTISTSRTGQYEDEAGGWDGLLRAALAEVGQVVRLPSLTPPTAEGSMAGLLETLPAPLYWVVTATAHHLHSHGLSANARRQARELAERMRQAGRLRPAGLDGGAPPTGQLTAAIPGTGSASFLDRVRNIPLAAAAEYLAGLDPVQQNAARQQAAQVISRYQPPNTTISFDEGEMDIGQLNHWYRIQYSLTLDPTGATADTLARQAPHSYTLLTPTQHPTSQSAPPTAVPATAAAPLDLDAVPLPELDPLRTQTPARPGEDASSGQRADYAMALALTSTPTRLLDNATHRADLVPNGTQQHQTRMVHGLLMGSGAYLHASSLAFATVQNMKRAYDLARQTDKNGKLLITSAVSRAITRGTDQKFLVEGFWLAVGLRETAVPDPRGARAIVRRAVETLANAIEVAEPGIDVRQKASRIARRIYRSADQPTEIQVAVVEELLRQRDENLQSFASLDPVLDPVELSEFDALRTRTPAPPGEDADSGQRADYAMALALTSTPTKPLKYKVHSMYLAPNAERLQIQSTHGLLIGSGAHVEDAFVQATVQNMRQSYDLARQTNQSGSPLAASGASSQLVGHNGNRLMVEGFWFAVGLRESGVPDPMGARAIVRRAVNMLASAMESAEPGIDVRQKASRIARRIYRSVGEPAEFRVAIVEELLRQRDENPRTFAPPTAASTNTTALVDLGAVPLPELSALRKKPVPPGEDAESGQRADYAMALALASTSIKPLKCKTHSTHLDPNAGKYKNQSAYGLLMGSGAHLADAIAQATAQNMRQSYDLARQTDKKGNQLAASRVSIELTGHNSITTMIEGFWLAVGLRESGVMDPMGARASVRRAVNTLAGVMEVAEPGIDVRQKASRIARRIYRSVGEPEEFQVAVVEELLRQRGENPQTFASPTADPATAAAAIDFDTVPLPEIDALRSQKPAVPGEDADGGRRADYAMALALTSTPVKPLSNKTHGKHLALVAGKSQAQSAHGFLMGSGAYLNGTVANATVQNMKQSYDLARQTNEKGKYLSANGASEKILGNSNNRLMFEAFWLAAGLREFEAMDPMGARASVRRAVNTLANAIEIADPGINVQQKALRITRRIYQSADSRTAADTEIQVAVVEELLRQRDENPQTFAPVGPAPANTSPAIAEPPPFKTEVSENVPLPDRMELSTPEPQKTQTPVPPGDDMHTAPSLDAVEPAESMARVGVRVEYVNGRFRAALQLRGIDDPSVTVDVSRWNFARRQILEALGGASALAAALATVRDAVRTFPPLARLIPADSAQSHTAAVGLEVELDEVGLARLDEVAGALSVAGVEVFWPEGYLDRLTTRTTIVKRAGRNAPTHEFSVIADQLLEFRWELALNGEPLTVQEMERLVAEESALVQLRGRLVLVRPGQREEIRGLIRRSGQGQDAGPGTGDSTVVVKSLAEVSESAAAAMVSAVPVGVQPLGGRLDQSLYPHQQVGVSWLTQVTGMGLGGILADEMGLGKTLQTLAVHLKRQQNPATAGPTLVVAPTSLLTVWQDEAAYWAPWVGTRVFHGGGRDLTLLASHEIVLTTYKTMVKSAEALGKVPWSLVVADEAQEIKNHQTRAAKAIRGLRSHARIALSGTPVENTLTDLWSILDWTTPGLLGTQADFVSSYGSGGKPTIPLAQLVAPFVLRRKKDGPNIQPKLIPATHTVHSPGLTIEQAARYEARIRKAIAERPQTGRMVGFYSALVHDLKQLCNHPTQFNTNVGPEETLTGRSRKSGELGQRQGQFNANGEPEEVLTGRSRKFDKLDELITGITGRGESVLVFTQYVGTGQLIMRHLRNRQITGLFLHGDISRKQRQQMVKDFRNGAANVFVISLKTGGLGLTLTRANHVIHYDQWWNPAVEEQATARAHRIGQTKPVEVHHLITHDTVEELIKNIQDSKANVADDLLEEIQNRFTELTDTQLDTALQGQFPQPVGRSTSPQPMEIDTDALYTDTGPDGIPTESRTVLGKRASQASPTPRKRRNTLPSGTLPDHARFLSFLAALTVKHSQPSQRNAATGTDPMGDATTQATHDTPRQTTGSEHRDDSNPPAGSERDRSSNGEQDARQNEGSERGGGERSVSRRRGGGGPGDSDSSSSSDSDSSDSDSSDSDSSSSSSDSSSSSSSSESSSSSNSSMPSLSSFGDELRKSGLDALVSAAETEADTAYEWTLPPPGRQRNQAVERVMSVAEQTSPSLGGATPWGMAVMYPYYAVHWNRLTRRKVTPQGGAALVRLLSYTPNGLDLTLDQLTTLISPADQLQPQAVDTLLQRMGVTLGPRALPPGENSAGQQVKPVEKALAEIGVTTRYPNGRLTPQAVTVLAAWAVHWGRQQAQDPNGNGMADPGGIAERIFGRHRDGATAFIRYQLDEFGVRHPDSPSPPPLAQTDETDDPQVTAAERKGTALLVAMVHIGHYGSVNAQQVGAILAGHPTPSPRQLDKALDLLEHSGYTHHLRGTTDWNTITRTTTGTSAGTGTGAGNAFGDTSVEAITPATSAGGPVRDVWGDLTDDGRTLLKAKALEFGGAQAARLGGVDLVELAGKVFSVGYRRGGLRLLRKWLKGSGLRILTANEAAVAQVLASRTESRALAISHGVDPDSLSFEDPDWPALVAVEPDPVLRGAKATAILEAGGFFGFEVTRSGASFNDMMVAVAFLEKDAADSRLHREEARQQARDSGGRLSEALLRASAEETRNDTLDFLAAQFLRGLPLSVARALADFWHQTFAFLGSLQTQSRRIALQFGSVLCTTPSAYRGLADRAKASVEAQDTFRPDYVTVAADLFQPSPTTWQIDAVHYMSGLSHAETSKKAAKAAARALLALVGDDIPPLPTADTPLQDRIDYALWKTALIINQNLKIKFSDLYRETFAEYTPDRISGDKFNPVRGWIEAFGLGGAESKTKTLPYIPEVIGSLRDAAFQRPSFRHLKRRTKQGDGVWRAGMVILGVRQALGMDGDPIPANGLRGKLVYAARMAGGMQGASVSEVAAQIFFTGKPGPDQRALISELLHPQLNLEDPQYPGIVQKMIDIIGDTIPTIPDQNSTPQQRAAWNALSEDTRRQQRIDFVIAKAVHGLARGAKIPLADLARRLFPDANPGAKGSNESRVRGWLESFGLDQQYFSQQDAEMLPHMPEAFEMIWQADTEKLPTLDEIGAVVFAPEIQFHVRLISWFHALGVNGWLPPGGVRGKLLAEVRARFGPGVSNPFEVAREVLGVKWPSPAQLVMAEQLLRLSGRWQPPTPGGAQGDPSVTAAKILSHYNGGAVPDPGIATTMAQRIDYAIWKAASTLHSGQEIRLPELSTLVFYGVSDHSTMLTAGTAPIGAGGRMNQLLGILTTVGLHSLHPYKSVTLFTSPAVGEYQLQKAWDGDGASPHSVSLEIIFPTTFVHQAFYRGVFETFGLRGAPLPATGIRADLKAAVTTAIQPGHTRGQGINPPQPEAIARLLFGEGPLTHVHFAVAEQWIKLAATDQPPMPPTNGPLLPRLNATLTRKAEYAVSRLLHTRTHNPRRRLDDVIAEITEDLFASPTDSYGLALTTGILEGTGLIPLGPDLTVEDIRKITDDAELQQDIYERVVTGPILTGYFRGRRHLFAARVRGILAGRGLLPPPRRAGPLRQLQQRIVDEGTRLQKAGRPLKPAAIARTVFHLTADPDKHQRTVVTEILRAYGLTPAPETQSDDMDTNSSESSSSSSSDSSSSSEDSPRLGGTGRDRARDNHTPSDSMDTGGDDDMDDGNRDRLAPHQIPDTSTTSLSGSSLKARRTNEAVRSWFQSLIHNGPTPPSTPRGFARPRPPRNQPLSRSSSHPGDEPRTGGPDRETQRLERAIYDTHNPLPLTLTETARNAFPGLPPADAVLALHTALITHSANYKAHYTHAQTEFQAQRNTSLDSDLRTYIGSIAVAHGLRPETGDWWYTHLDQQPLPTRFL